MSRDQFYVMPAREQIRRMCKEIKRNKDERQRSMISSEILRALRSMPKEKPEVQPKLPDLVPGGIWTRKPLSLQSPSHKLLQAIEIPLSDEEEMGSSISSKMNFYDALNSYNYLYPAKKGNCIVRLKPVSVLDEHHKPQPPSKENRQNVNAMMKQNNDKVQFSLSELCTL